MAVVHAQMLNYTPGEMTFHQEHRWSGTVQGTYPSSIKLNGEASFTHNGKPSSNFMASYGGVSYIGTNQDGVADDCLWILAWHVPGDGTNNRVYVKTEPLGTEPHDPVDWPTIKISLDKSSNTSDFNDENNNVKASASITSGNRATISATFYY